MPRRKKSVVKENSERWLITYSDLITLLLIFFVIMYAMSKVDVAKFMTLSESLNAALNPSNQIPLQGLGKTALLAAENPTQGHNQGFSLKAGSKAQMIQLQNILKEDVKFSNLYQELKQFVSKRGLENSLSITNQQRGIQITLRDVVLFATGQDQIRPQAVHVLQQLVPFLQTLSNQIQIEGYTDNVPIHTAQFPSNWELSTGRALNVVEDLIQFGVNPTRLSAVGYGQYHPVVPNSTAAGRQQNRRVNIVILRSTYSLQQGESSFGAQPNALAAITPAVGVNRNVLISQNTTPSNLQIPIVLQSKSVQSGAPTHP
ncbi:flagellar motor protein MotB [Ferroacidibacillus organovorans]|uniref:OmpA-like domain-containing protein n=1 Tax=Ferroacidibacillus organovorans TaxID=1765683 RepID=A0A853KDB3_9BACL|nr:flagellar motor protein MotB [Ferroacidibacillus organovorans]KYP80165.1 hypothetical protein AYJ22_02695 [Ferroacidibacillus organovorans]OAG95042.1 hypothetical protein AYW79_02170 [Ferroacidibacillus organovorans]